MDSKQPRDTQPDSDGSRMCVDKDHVGSNPLPISEFAKHRRVCKKCRAASERQWRQNNAEYVTEQARDYNQDPERKRIHAEQQRSYYWRDHERA
jgi:hypothetical protein